LSAIRVAESKFALLTSLFVLLTSSFSLADGPAVQWEKTFGGTQTWYALTSDQPAPPEIKFEGDEIIVTLPGFFYSTKTVNDKKYSQISIPNHALFMNKGYPELPKVRFNMLIPKDAEAHCELIAVDAMDIELSTPIPSRGNLLRDVDPATVPYVEGDFYRGDKAFPGEEYHVDSTFVFRGAYGLPIEFYPIQYDPAEDLLRVYKTIRIKWSIDVDAYRAFAFKRTPREFDEMFKETFVNYQSMRGSGSLNEPGRLIIITADAFIDAVRPLAEWKIQRGLKTEIVKMSEIGTTAQAIKDYITTQYQSPESLSYVVLVGDSDTIPTLYGTYEGAACDSCMAMVDGNDPYPDLFISRLSARTVAQVENQVNKFIRYERNPDIDGAWYLRGIGVASNEGLPTDWQWVEGLRAALEGYGFTEVAKIYDPGASTAALIAALNTGASVLNYRGHGYGMSWETTGFSTNDATALTNGYMNPFIIDASCLNGSFLWSDTCLAESFLRAGTTEAPAGAIAMYSASTRTSWDPPGTMQDAVIKDLLVTNIKHTTGGLYFGGMVAALNDWGTGTIGLRLVQQYNIFGDASLSVRSKKPAVLSVTYPSAFPPTGPVEVKVFTQEPHQPLFDATVALTYKGTIVSVAQTNNAGVATLEYAPIELRNPSMLLLTVFAPNTVPLMIKLCGLIGDLDCDGAVNFEDLGILTDQWLQPPSIPSADIAPAPTDGIVNFVDYSILAENWFKLSPPDPASNPNPPDGATEVRFDADLSWIAGCYATSHDVYFGTNFEDVNDANNSLPVGTSSYKGNQIETTFDPGIMALNTIYYWRIDEVNPYYGTIAGPVWSLTTIWSLPASNPNPPDGSTNVSATHLLSWTPGEGATSHDVYFGTQWPGTFQCNQTGTTFNPGNLTPSTWYYWRIDEVNPHSVTTGWVWSFKTGSAPEPASNPNPADGATNQPKSILYWNAGETADAHDVYFGSDRTAVENADTSSPLYIDHVVETPGVQPCSTKAVTLQQASKTYYWRIDEVEADCVTIHKGDVWTFSRAGFKAYSPSPADGAINQPKSILYWNAGETANAHDVYFGTDRTAVENADTSSPEYIEQTNQLYSSIVSGLQLPMTTYYWRIDEVEADGITIHKGDVWSFTVMPLQAWDPSPTNGQALVILTPTLYWNQGAGAISSVVYFGTSSTNLTYKRVINHTNDVLRYNWPVTPTPLAYNTTYYWRIDMREPNNAILKGDVWMFKTLIPIMMAR
jgi:hypothetical protein